MNIRKSFARWCSYHFLAVPLLPCFFIYECFKKDIYEACIDFLKEVKETKDSDLGFFFIIKNTELVILKTSFRLKYLIIVKFWKYAMKDLKQQIYDGKL